MNKVAIRFIWFAFGVSIGVLAVFHDYVLRPPEASVTALTFSETDSNQLISIRSEEDALARRKELTSFIWGAQGFPASPPDKFEENIKDERYSSLRNLKQINRVTMLMEWGFSSTGYHFIPEHGNNKLLIYHRGHDGDFVGGIGTIDFFLGKGFSVIALSMPLEPPNNRPIVDLKHIGKIQITFHDQLKLLEMKSGDPVQLFLTPVAVSLNYAQRFGYDSVYMTGVSGGGWTTTLYAATDPRITRSYPVAGTLPLHLREDRKRSNTAHRSADWGDYEQTIPELYRIANYLELYVLSSYGPQRKQLQILNKYDPCCLAGDASKTYEGVVNQRVHTLGSGEFAVYLNTSQKIHEFSDEALRIIAEDANTVNMQALK
ncbi:MAG: hypothetical protein M3539_11535 [Acidobacteriota bacterium]|nr:hypothetical protein [Acidobacteriota bacterium]